MSASVRAESANGRYVEARMLLDTGSNANLITTNLVRKLGLSVQPSVVSVSGVSGLHTTSVGVVELTIKSRVNEFKKVLTFFVVPTIAERVPAKVFPRHSVRIPKNIRLADPRFHQPAPIDLLVCASATVSFLSVGQINLFREACELYLQKTILGWVAVGGVHDDSNESITCNLIELNEQIRKFWELEEGAQADRRSIEDVRCEEYYANTVRRNEHGRYVVRLPFRDTEPELGNSRGQAIRRLASMQRKLSRDQSLQVEYNRILQEYLSLGHMSRVAGEPTDGCFLPHHAVIKPSSVTTKVRIVFDASAKSDSGQSLNDSLLTGPTIQPKLFEHLVRFRGYRYVVTADIEQMYRQVLVDPRDRKYQRIVWRSQHEIETFELNTVTFGVSAAPFLAIRTLQQLADDEQTAFPRASIILRGHLYVDDLLTGADTLKEISLIRDNLITLLERGGFHIRKWASNHRHALDNLEQREFTTNDCDKQGEPRSTLGVKWLAASDEFVFSVKPINVSGRITKRQILSDIARIFDPFGLLGPLVFALKRLMQDCWKAKIDWDEAVPQEIENRWRTVAAQLLRITRLAIPRYVLIPNPVQIEMHGFCDASESGYGACIYLRSIDTLGNVLVRLVCSRSRVAPVKQITIPRLELCGAVLLGNLYDEIRELFEVSINQIIFWSDSQIVLAWLKRDPRALSVFVGNRVARLQRLPERIEWRHVISQRNLADSLSRGQTPIEFIDNKAWFEGMPWLKELDESWVSGVDETIQFELPELRATSCLLVTAHQKVEYKERPFYFTMSLYNRMVNTIAYCLRYRSFTSRQVQTEPLEQERRAKISRLPLLKRITQIRPLGVEERVEAERRLLRLIQAEQFGNEIERIGRDLPIKSSRLSALSPFIDQHGLLRVGGRLRNAEIDDDQKYPIILPSYHHVTDALIRETHLRTLHSGTHSTLYAMRQRFWLLDGKNQVRKIVRGCARCIRHRPAQVYAKMGNLPKARINWAPVFEHVGIDFFGPVLLKEKEQRNRVTIKGSLSSFRRS